MKLYRLLLRNSKGIVILATVLGLASGAASTLIVAMVASALAHPSQVDTQFFLRFAGALVLVIATYLSSRLALIRLTEQSYFEVQVYLARQILSAPYRRLEEIGAPALLASLSQDVGAVSMFLYMVPNLALHGAIIATCIAYLMWLSWQAGVLLLMVMVPAVLSYWVVNRRARKLLLLARRDQDKQYEQFEALTEGAKELRLHRPRRLSFFRDQFLKTAEHYRNSRIAGRNLHEIANAWSHILYFVFILILLLITSRSLDLPVAVLSGYALVALYMRSSVTTVLNALPTINMARVALDAIERLGLPEPDEATLSPDDSVAVLPIRRLHLCDVSYRYTGVLEEHSFTLRTRRPYFPAR